MIRSITYLKTAKSVVTLAADYELSSLGGSVTTELSIIGYRLAAAQQHAGMILWLC